VVSIYGCLKLGNVLTVNDWTVALDMADFGRLLRARQLPPLLPGSIDLDSKKQVLRVARNGQAGQRFEFRVDIGFRGANFEWTIKLLGRGRKATCGDHKSFSIAVLPTIAHMQP
jgi:hypothetical protein